ncbi:MAG: hypothetical protein MUO82_11265, partial [Candidatus Thermoplasmatota archaeon]|nr:hypothetical protein [Candidatus Thermoplasmatota archaeon]
EWGDGTDSGWLGLYPSGKEISANQSWKEKGTYLIKGKAKDIYGAESDWGTLEVTMPKNKMNYQFDILFERLLHHFLFFEKILNQYYN